VEHDGVVTSLARRRQNTTRWQGLKTIGEFNSIQQEAYVICMVKYSCARFGHH
jgi:hypothetical protein